MSKAPDGWRQLVGARVRRVRTQRGLTQGALAQAAGVGRGLVGRVEAGRSVVLLRSLWRLADGLGIHIIDLVAEPGMSRLDQEADCSPGAGSAGGGGTR
jgi:transcriptional regulator with XRE-family HTH domain